MDSILDSIKQVLGFESDYTYYDVDLIMHINSHLAVLNDVGIGPDEGYFVADKNAKWADFFTERAQNMIKTWLFLKVRLIFDPPESPIAVTAMDKQADEFFWRLTEIRKRADWKQYLLAQQSIETSVVLPPPELE